MEDKDEYPSTHNGLSREEMILHQNSILCVSFSATFTAAATFFTGLIITQFKQLGPSVSIPTLMLIISTFGFMYATLVYSNIGGLLYKKQQHRAERSWILGTSLSEYLGVYLLVLAIPFIINLISTEFFLRSATFTADMLGLAIYHFSGFSIMERHYKKYHISIFAGIFVLELFSMLYQLSDINIFELLSSILIIVILILGYISLRKVL